LFNSPKTKHNTITKQKRKTMYQLSSLKTGRLL